MDMSDIRKLEPGDLAMVFVASSDFSKVRKIEVRRSYRLRHDTDDVVRVEAVYGKRTFYVLGGACPDAFLTFAEAHKYAHRKLWRRVTAHEMRLRNSESKLRALDQMKEPE